MLSDSLANSLRTTCLSVLLFVRYPNEVNHEFKVDWFVCRPKREICIFQIGFREHVWSVLWLSPIGGSGQSLNWQLCLTLETDRLRIMFRRKSQNLNQLIVAKVLQTWSQGKARHEWWEWALCESLSLWMSWGTLGLLEWRQWIRCFRWFECLDGFESIGDPSHPSNRLMDWCERHERLERLERLPPRKSLIVVQLFNSFGL